MASKALDKITDEVGDKLEAVQEWLQGLSKNLPTSKQLRSYLPHQEPKRSIALPVALVVGGLALIGAITLLSTVPVRTLKKMPARALKKMTSSEPVEKKEARESIHTVGPLG